MKTIVNFSDLIVASNLQVEEAWMEYSCRDELDNVRLAMSRALGVAEPVLYDDLDEDDLDECSIQPEATSEDWDRILNDVIDIQERMATGMKMINEANDILVAAQNKRIPYEAYIAWCERRKKLWAHWKYLKDCCQEQIGEDKWLWVKYFQLAECSVDRNGYTNDDMECPAWIEDLDELKELYEDSSLDDYQE